MPRKDLKDIQSESDPRNLPIDKVGVKDISYPVVVLDRAAACELLVLATCAGRVSNPLAFGRELASSSGDTAGAW